MKSLKVWQGTGVVTSISQKSDDFVDLSTVTAIEVYIDTPKQIVKTIGSGVTVTSTTDYELTLLAADTNDVPSGEYDIQARITDATGIPLFGRIQPGKLRVIDSVFTTTD